MNQFLNEALVTLRAEPNNVIMGFFSDVNIQKIQNDLKKNVKKQINVEIDDQSCREIYVAMIYVYKTYGKNSLQKEREEIIKLNDITVKLILPDLISNILQYLNYIKDISKQPTPLQHGKNTSIKGTNSLELNALS